MIFEKKCGIYCIENLINSKKYIGQSNNVYKRVQRNKQLLKNNKDGCNVLQNAYNLYGKENFIYYIIEYCDSNLLDEKEIYYIKELHSHISEHGYNTSFGGESFFRGVHHSEESKRKISENSNVASGIDSPRYGKPLSEETRSKISSTLKEYYKTHKSNGFGKRQSPESIQKRADGNRGKIISEETRQKISKANKGKVRSEEVRLKQSERRKGIPISEETKKKMSIAQKGKTKKRITPVSEKTKKKMSIAMTGKRKKNSNNKYVGASLSYGKWHSYINYMGKRIELGTYKYEIEAALAYNKKAIELYGEDARLNIIDEEELKIFNLKKEV